MTMMKVTGPPALAGRAALNDERNQHPARAQAKKEGGEDQKQIHDEKQDRCVAKANSGEMPIELLEYI